MESAIERINTILMHLHAVEQILIENNITTEADLLARIRDAEGLPNRIIGIKTLKEMLSQEGESNEKNS
jgi:hypothetical protein